MRSRTLGGRSPRLTRRRRPRRRRRRRRAWRCPSAAPRTRPSGCAADAAARPRGGSAARAARSRAGRCRRATRAVGGRAAAAAAAPPPSTVGGGGAGGAGDDGAARGPCAGSCARRAAARGRRRRPWWRARRARARAGCLRALDAPAADLLHRTRSPRVCVPACRRMFERWRGGRPPPQWCRRPHDCDDVGRCVGGVGPQRAQGGRCAHPPSAASVSWVTTVRARLAAAVLWPARALGRRQGAEGECALPRGGPRRLQPSSGASPVRTSYAMLFRSHAVCCTRSPLRGQLLAGPYTHPPAPPRAQEKRLKGNPQAECKRVGSRYDKVGHFHNPSDRKCQFSIPTPLSAVRMADVASNACPTASGWSLPGP